MDQFKYLHGSTLEVLTKLTPEFVYKPVPVDLSLLDLDKMRRNPKNQKWMDFESMTPNFEWNKLEYESEYRSAFGVFVLDGLTMPGSGPYECKTAMARMIALRQPTKEGFSDRLAANQDDLSIRFEPQLKELVSYIKERWTNRNPETLLPAWVHAPHPKKKLRERTNDECLAHGRADFDDHKPVDFKLKFGELLEQSKKRGIGDLGVYRTHATACVVPDLKAAWSGIPIFESLKKLKTEFVVGPEKDKMRSVFKNLLEPGDDICYVYHSDDCCMSAQCSDGLVLINGDIVKCDGSHRTPMLKLLEELIREAQGLDATGNDYFARAFRELYKPLRFKYKSKHRGRRKQQVVYHFTTGRLYSGSSLTTLINNFANLLIAFALGKRVPDPRLLTRAEMLEAYVLAGEDVGYELKAGVCECIEDVQFLKCSPSRIETNLYPEGYCYEPWLGLGVHVRGFGTFKGDLPGTGPVEGRVSAFLSGLVQGRRLWGDHEFYDSFHAAYYCSSTPKGEKLLQTSRVADVISDEKSKLLGENLGKISALSVCKRYKISLEDYERVCRIVKNAGPFFNMRDPVFDVFYRKDYG